MGIINYLKIKINSFKDNEQIIGECEKVKKGKLQVEEEKEELKEELDNTKDELIKVNRELRESGVWHDKYNEQKKFNSEILELILKEAIEIRTLVQEINNKFTKEKKENRRLSKENEELLAKQLGE